MATESSAALYGTRTYSYDADGNLKQEIDRDGRQTTYTYDGLNRRLTEKRYAVSTDASPYYTIGYVYNGDGTLATATAGATATRAITDAGYSYDYYGDGNVEKCTRSWAGSAPRSRSPRPTTPRAMGNRTLLPSMSGASGVQQSGNELYFEGPASAVEGFDESTLSLNFVSRQGVGSGPYFKNDHDGVAINGGTAYVAAFHQSTRDPSAFTDGVIKVDLTTANRTLLTGSSYFGNGVFTTAGSGPRWAEPVNIALEANDQPLLTTNSTGGVMRVDPMTGVRSTWAAGRFFRREVRPAYMTNSFWQS